LTSIYFEYTTKIETNHLSCKNFLFEFVFVTHREIVEEEKI